MLRGIVTVLLLVLLAVGCWMLFSRISGGNSVRSGDVYSLNSSEKDQMESGTTFLGDKPLQEAHPTPSRSDEPGTINTEPAPNAQYNAYVADTRIPGTSGDTQQYTVYPDQDQTANQAQNQPASTQVPQGTPNQPYSPYGQQPYKPYSPARPVSTDTFSPNPPNGFAYAGSGAYEVYRQGDLTFRLDTKTGSSCVLYATMDEWAKPIVYSHGCGTRGWRKRWQWDRDHNTPLTY